MSLLDQLKNEEDALKTPDNNNVEKGIEMKRQTDKIQSLLARLESDKSEAQQKFDSKVGDLKEARNKNEERRKDLLDKNQNEIEQRRNEYSQKMLEDSGRYNQLQVQKEEEKLTYDNALQKTNLEHTNKIAEEKEKHRKDIEIKNNKIQQMRREIKQMEEENDEILKQIAADTEFEIEDIRKKNENNKSQVNDMSLKSKAELQLTQNKLQDIENEIEVLQRQQKDKQFQIDKQQKECAQLKSEIAKKNEQIAQKDTQIANREHKIYKLKKKTQELEKFKFVLDYKIKDLKRDITPQQEEIQNLKQQTNELDSKLKHFNQVNSGLGLTVDQNRQRQDEMQAAIDRSKTQIRRNNTQFSSYRKAVYDVTQFIDDYDAMKIAFHTHLYPFVEDNQRKQEDVDKDIKKEFNAQANFLKASNKKLQD